MGVFAAGTALFVGASFITITVALTVLGVGVFGRVIAMWIAWEMIKTKPVLHRVVRNRGMAAEYVEGILVIDGLVVEIMGHMVGVVGRSWAALFSGLVGVLGWGFWRGRLLWETLLGLEEDVTVFKKKAWS